MNWISIKDEIPPVGERVLTYGGWGVVMDEYVFTISEDIPWFIGTRDEYNEEVTHWTRINLPE
jgi:hypothetical protein